MKNRYGAPDRIRTCIIQLCANRLEGGAITEAWDRAVVELRGFEPLTSPMRRERSPAELQPQVKSKFGGARRARTVNPLDAIEVLSH
jgi:hypothetical protein